MNLTYTVEIELRNAGGKNARKLGEPAEVSEEIMRAAFDHVGKRFAGYSIHYLTIWAHEDSKLPEDVDLGVESIGEREFPPHSTCETCGITRFEMAADRG